MSLLDYVVLSAYMAGVCVIGLLASAKVRNSADLFAAGRQAPWWVSGLSSYMTMFSAATFVVWGSVAYRYGIVAVVINLTYGAAALMVGFFVAGRWRSLGVMTAAEFVELRFGKAALAGFTAMNLAAKTLSIGVGLYALAVMICALAPLPAGSVLRDPGTGHLSVAWTTVMLGGLVVAFTATGGLWAVLVTDVVQFVIIMTAVCFVAPLILHQTGGFEGFVASAPDGFFLPARGEWTWWILMGWCAIQFVMIGAEWAFVQRYLCVSSRRSAQKSAWLFGALYLVTPLLWMLPPMIYRTINPTADPEQAYILACQAVLPTGTLGLMLAAMAAATLSGIDSQLNVFAGVLTSDFYKPYVNPQADDATMMRVGRVLTVALGGALIVVALLAPRWGGAEAFVVKVASLYVGPLLLPTLWGLFSRKLDSSAMWITVALSAVASTVVFGLQSSVVAAGTLGGFAATIRWLQDHPRHADMLVGLALPLAALALLEICGRGTSPGWTRVAERRIAEVRPSGDDGTAFTLQAAGWTLVGSCLLMASIMWIDLEQLQVMAVFAGALLTLGVALLVLARKLAQGNLQRRLESTANASDGLEVANCARSAASRKPAAPANNNVHKGELRASRAADHRAV